MKKVERSRVGKSKRKHVRKRMKLTFSSAADLYTKPEPEEIPTRVVDLVEKLHQQEAKQAEAEAAHAMANAQVNLLADEVRRTRFEIDGVALTFGFADACPEDGSIFSPIVCVEVREDQKSSGGRMAMATIPLSGLADLVAWARAHGIE